MKYHPENVTKEFLIEYGKLIESHKEKVIWTGDSDSGKGFKLMMDFLCNIINLGLKFGVYKND